MNSHTDKRAAVEAIRRELDSSRGSRIWTDYVNALRLVSQVVFTRSSGFVLEFIQNAEDAGQGLPGKGEISININQQRLKFVHNGRPFDNSNLGAICGIRSSKKPERGTLGYLGIGFKSVFKVADCVEVYSNGYRFKFDRNHPDWSACAADTPWHVIPIWIDEPSEPIDADKTTFIIQLRNEEARAHLMEGLKSIRAELYLFLKWIKSISIADDVSGETWKVEDSGSTADGITTLKQNAEEHRFKFFRREVTVPEHVKPDRLTQEYRANVTKREIAIAFAMDAKGNLDPSPSTAMYGGVYSFLPLGESKSGAKFPIQADFLVQPGRDSINAEALWNQWLLDEVASLCLEAIQYFQQHEVWKYQYLAAFEFKRNAGFEAYEKLFGPRLIDPVEKSLAASASVLTAEDKWAAPSDVVLLDETQDALKALTDLGLMAPEEIAPVFGGTPNLKPVHPKVAAAQPTRFKKVNRWTFFNNQDFLSAKAQSSYGPAWFRRLYSWLNKYPVHEEYFYRTRKWRLLGYHNKEIVLRSDKTISTGGPTFVLDLGTTDPFLANLAYELQATKPTLHPDILAGAPTDQDRESLKGFLTGLAGVQKMDAKTVCLEAILPKIETTVPAPPLEELLTFTKYCQKHLPSPAIQGKELWVINKRAQVRKAAELLFSSEFTPAADWETHQRYVPGTDFLSADYVAGCANPNDLRAWREFLHAGGVKWDPDNGIEVFAMKFAEDKLASRFKNMVPVDKLNHGYDMAAEDAAGQKVHLEIKGLSAEGNVELTGNEAKAAKAHGQSFYLCVVSGIPGTPALHLVRDPDRVGEKDKLTIRAADWKRERIDPAAPQIP
jgi:hypothetical protein